MLYGCPKAVSLAETRSSLLHMPQPCFSSRPVPITQLKCQLFHGVPLSTIQSSDNCIWDNKLLAGCWVSGALQFSAHCLTSKWGTLQKWGKPQVQEGTCKWCAEYQDCGGGRRGALDAFWVWNSVCGCDCPSGWLQKFPCSSESLQLCSGHRWHTPWTPGKLLNLPDWAALLECNPPRSVSVSSRVFGGASQNQKYCQVRKGLLKMVTALSCLGHKDS